MPSLPKTPFTDIQDFRVAVDAPVSTDLMTDIVVDLNYLDSILRDGAAAVADIDANNVTVRGNEQVDGNLNVTGTLTVGDFFKSSDLLFLTAL